MSILTYQLEVTMEDEEPFEVKADQRDFAAFEGSSFYSDDNDRFHTKVRYWAWAALRRNRDGAATKLDFAKWSEKCIQVKLIAADDGEGEQTEDPTRT